jgi:catechol 2,3-dioxygenase-like lactoylglutathione lyase family enzyme
MIFSHIGLTTRRLDELVSFFQTYLEFELVTLRESKTFPGKGYRLAFLKQGNCVVELLSSHSESSSEAISLNSFTKDIYREQESHIRPRNHIAFEVESVENFLQTLKYSSIVKEFFIHKDLNCKIIQAFVEVDDEIVLEILQSN